MCRFYSALPLTGIIAEGAVDFDSVGRTLLRIGIFAAVSALAAYVMNLVNNHMTYRVVEDLRLAAIKRLQKLPLSYLDSHSTGDIVSRVIADTSTLSDGLLLGFTQLFSGIVTIGVTLVFMFSKNVWVSLLVMLLTPLSFFVAKFVSSRSFHMFRKQSEVRGRQTALIEEMIGGQKIVHSFGYEDKASARFEKVNRELADCSLKAVFYSSLTNPSTRFVNNIIYAGVALLGHLYHFGRRAYGRRSFGASFLCQPIYEAVQRHQLGHHGNAEMRLRVRRASSSC